MQDKCENEHLTSEVILGDYNGFYTAFQQELKVETMNFSVQKVL